jgi:hypothetical protein
MSSLAFSCFRRGRVIEGLMVRQNAQSRIEISGGASGSMAAAKPTDRNPVLWNRGMTVAVSGEFVNSEAFREGAERSSEVLTSTGAGRADRVHVLCC